MAVYVDIPDLSGIELQVDLRGRDIGMAEHFLYALDIRALGK